MINKDELLKVGEMTIDTWASRLHRIVDFLFIRIQKKIQGFKCNLEAWKPEYHRRASAASLGIFHV